MCEIGQTKRMLFVKCTRDVSQEIVDSIQAICKILNISFVLYDWLSHGQFEKDQAHKGPYDFLFLAAHGSHLCFGEAPPSSTTQWSDFSYALCRAGCLNNDAIVFLGCCHGGLKRVALTLFENCDEISYICGPRWTVPNVALSTAINVLLYNVVHRDEDPSFAAERVSTATGQGFPFYDRYELDTELTIRNIDKERVK